MCHKQLPQITARDIHALWLLIKSGLEFHEADLQTISQTVLESSDNEDVQKILKIGEYIGFLSHRNGKWTLTKEGQRFSSSSHWRLWTPLTETQNILDENNIHNLFIDREKHEERKVIIDLFAGAGGLSLGFTAAGFNVALAIENDQQACEAHSKNFPQTLVIQDDINKFANNPIEYLSQIEQLQETDIAGIIGGPPCQGFSYMGERVAEDERNLLTSRFLDIVLALEPDFFVMENVPGLATIGIQPKFSNYITGLAKSNGRPASLMIDRWPSIPKVAEKNNRKFRKKIITNLIKIFKDHINLKLKTILPECIEIKNLIIYSYKKLKTIIYEAIIKTYHDEELTQKILKEDEYEISTIAIASVFSCFLKNDIISKKNIRNTYNNIKNMNFDNKSLIQTIVTISHNYDSLPPAKEYKGKKVGSVLLHILERASYFYNIPAPQILNAASFGTPQKRKRMFIVGIHKRLDRTFHYPEPTHRFGKNELQNRTPTVREVLQDLPDIDKIPAFIDGHEFSVKRLAEAKSDFALKMRCELIEHGDLSLPRASWSPYLIDCSNPTNHSEKVIERFKVLEPGKEDSVSRIPRLHPDGLSPTLRAGTRENKGSHTAVRPIHYKYHRVISVREGARLMGYPDWMTFHKTKWHGFRLVGNGVPFPLSNAIAKQIKKLLYESS